VIDAVALPDPLKDLAFLGPQLLRNNQLNRSPDGFGRGIAEQALGALVPGQDDAFQRHADDRIVRGRDDGGEQRSSFFFSFLLGNVEHQAAAVEQAPLVPQAVGIDEHFLD
jgi:hypothetical protein